MNNQIKTTLGFLALITLAGCGGKPSGPLCGFERADGSYEIRPYYSISISGAAGSATVDATVGKATALEQHWIDNRVEALPTASTNEPGACGYTIDATVTVTAGTVPYTATLKKDGVVVQTQTVNSLNTPAVFSN